MVPNLLLYSLLLLLLLLLIITQLLKMIFITIRINEKELFNKSSRNKNV